MYQQPSNVRDVTYDIVIPCFNRVDVIERAVESVLKQTCRPERLILVDDGSTDGTSTVLLALAAKEPCIHPIILPRNVGVSAARNAGLASGTSDWIAFLDSDDVWLPAASEALLAETQRPDVDVIVGHFQRWWPDGIIDPPECGWDGGGVREALMRSGAIGPSWSLMRRSLPMRLGGFDTSYHNCNDWDFFTRAAASGACFVRIDDAIALYTYSASGRLSHDEEKRTLNASRVMAHPFLQTERSAA